MKELLQVRTRGIRMAMDLAALLGTMLPGQVIIPQVDRTAAAHLQRRVMALPAFRLIATTAKSLVTKCSIVPRNLVARQGPPVEIPQNSAILSHQRAMDAVKPAIFVPIVRNKKAVNLLRPA